MSSGDTDGLWRCGAADASVLGGAGIDDEVVDELLENAIGNGGGVGGVGRVYTVVVVMDKEDHEEVRVVVGKNRHAWILGKISETDAINMISEIFVKFFMKGGREEGESPQGEGEFMPVGLDGSVILSFSLLNANPNDGIYDWELQKAEKQFLAPIVEALAPIADISVESQVLYHTPKASISYWDNNLGSYVFSTKDLPFFVNSNEWHLDTSTAAAGRAKVLQFVVYVPSVNECPLLLRLPNGQTSKTNGFISPMWGGIVVWNPPRCSGNSQPTQVSRKTLSPEDMQKIFQVIVGQLRLLFGFKSDYLHGLQGGRLNILTSKRGFTEWELDVLFRRHACSYLLSCATTLESLSKLVQSLPRMIVTDEIGKQVKFSLEAAGSAQNNASLGVYDAAAVSSRKARVLAEDAFFHPSIMSISYSSIEHYFAIYMPFFAPVALHVLLAAVKELKRYKRERAKYISFVTSKDS